ncbi:MAG TPA: hypothetical protein GX504_11355 [Clostridia bacterium]|nr:hypothetical protein [Clostridia bacterium]
MAWVHIALVGSHVQNLEEKCSYGSCHGFACYRYSCPGRIQHCRPGNALVPEG